MVVMCQSGKVEGASPPGSRPSTRTYLTEGEETSHRLSGRSLVVIGQTLCLTCLGGGWVQNEGSVQPAVTRPEQMSLVGVLRPLKDQIRTSLT